jgi:dienelactone hydrolase
LLIDDCSLFIERQTDVAFFDEQRTLIHVQSPTFPRILRMKNTMSPLLYVILIVVCLCASFSLSAPPTTTRANGTVPSGLWDASLFAYQRAEQMAVEETTPTEAQVDFRFRPPQLKPNAAAPRATDRRAKPVTAGRLDIVRLAFRDSDDETVPALLCTPHGKSGPFPLVVAVHGLRSNKAQVCGQVAAALAGKGFAVLAPDMPFHGERPGEPATLLDRENPLRAFAAHRRAVLDVRQCIDVAEDRKDLDVSRGVILLGYSMGSWIDAVAGSADERVKSMVLMVGGAMDIPPAALLIPQIAACDPRLAITHFVGPLLMLTRNDDEVVTPAMSRRLFAVAPEPKKQVWYDSGHLLPAKAYEDAAQWIAERWEELEGGQGDKGSGGQGD